MTTARVSPCTGARESSQAARLARVTSLLLAEAAPPGLQLAQPGFRPIEQLVTAAVHDHVRPAAHHPQVTLESTSVHGMPVVR